MTASTLKGDAAWLGCLVRHPIKRYGVVIGTELREFNWRHLHVRWLDKPILEELAGDGDVPPSEEWLRYNSVIRVDPESELRILGAVQWHLMRRYE
jgi:hypothetical protein